MLALTALFSESAVTFFKYTPLIEGEPDNPDVDTVETREPCWAGNGVMGSTLFSRRYSFMAAL